jgi:uncharacterized membrane protein
MCATASLLFFVSSNQKEVWENWKKYIKLFPKFFLINILFALMVLIGLILFIVPGIYLAVRYAFVGYIFLEKPETKIEQIFTESARLTEGNRVSIFLLMALSLIAIVVLMGIVGFILGGASEPLFSVIIEITSYLLVAPLVTLVSIAAYDLLKKNEEVAPKEPAKEDPIKATEPEPIAIAPEPAL